MNQIQEANAGMVEWKEKPLTEIPSSSISLQNQVTFGGSRRPEKTLIEDPSNLVKLFFLTSQGSAKSKYEKA